MILFFDYLWLGRSLKQTFMHGAIPLLLSVGVAIFLPLLWRQNNLVNIHIGQDFVSRTGLVFWSLGHYLKTALWPFGLSPLYAEYVAGGGILSGCGSPYLQCPGGRQTEGGKNVSQPLPQPLSALLPDRDAVASHFSYSPVPSS